MMNALLNHQSEVSARHRANIAASLAHRLAQARAARNFQLLSLLEQEQQQLNQRQPTQTNLSTLTQWGKAVWNRLVNATASPAVSIQAKTGDSGAVIWRAYNPTTGETRYAETEAEVIDWVESQQYVWSYAATASLPCCRSRSISSSR